MTKPVTRGPNARPDRRIGLPSRARSVNGVRVTAAGRRLGAMVEERGTVELQAIRPSAALMAVYEKRLDAAVAEMNRSVSYWVTARYKANSPELAMDASPAMELRRAMRKLTRRWQRNFDELAPKLAEYFATQTQNRTDGEFERMLRKAGFSVKFTATKAMNDAYQAVIGENVSLIKSVAAQHLASVEGLVMRSVQSGGDLQVLVDGLEKSYGVTRRRAQGIARSQTRMATSTLVRARQQELGVRKAKWLHSAGGKTPRPEHVAFSGQLYDVEKGHDFHNGEGIVWPGRAINCRCVSIPIIPGLENL